MSFIKDKNLAYLIDSLYQIAFKELINKFYFRYCVDLISNLNNKKIWLNLKRMAALPPCPPQLKSVQHYLKLASDYESREPVIAYWGKFLYIKYNIYYSSITENSIKE